MGIFGRHQKTAFSRTVKNRGSANSGFLTSNQWEFVDSYGELFCGGISWVQDCCEGGFKVACAL